MDRITKETPNSKADRIMNGVAVWCSYYRANPHRFAKDYLNIELKLFQKILLFMMNISTNFMYIASRGQGKTYLIAIFCAIRCILYPGTKICVASKNRQQGAEVVTKIIELLKPNSPNLRLEIEHDVNTAIKSEVIFRNSSTIKVVTANDGARHNRSNVIFLDEFRMVDPMIINTVIRKFNTAPRQPKYLNKPEYAHMKERNKEMYASSAYYKSSWSFEKMKSYCKALFDDTKSYFLCGLPYQLSIKENLLDENAVEDEMSENDFVQMQWDMEMGALWFGENEHSFYSFDDLSSARKLKYPFYPKYIYEHMPDKKFKLPDKERGEIRILSSDIAVMGGKKNDATAIFLIQLIPNKRNQYIRKTVYAETIEGGHTETQALLIRKLYNSFDCDYIALDTYGVGIGVFDALAKDLIDDETGEFYPALSCMNDDEMHKRCKSDNPDRVIFSVKASSEFNSECAQSLRDAIRTGKMLLLVNDIDAEDTFNDDYKQFRKLSEETKVKFLLPYIHTNLLITEMINLEYEMKNNRIKIVEKAGNRKDRYSALAYGNYFANVLERQLKPQRESTPLSFTFRAPKTRTSISRL